MTQSPVGARKILVAGGGIGGICAALALLRAGHHVEVYEQASELKEVGAGLWLSRNGVRVLAELGLEQAMTDASIAPDVRYIRLWSDGSRWPLYQRGTTAPAHQPFLLLRAHLLKMLIDAVRREKPDAVHLNSRCAGYVQDGEGVSLRFRDATEARGDVLIGSDGVHSAVRTQMLGEVKARFTDAIAWRGLVPMDRLSEHQRKHVLTTWVGPLAHITVYPVRWRDVDLLTFSGQVEHDGWQREGWNEIGSKEECLRDFAGWHPDVMEMIENVDQLHRWGLFVRERLPRWSEGRVTLLGDACHSMVPYLGQGVNMAIEDAFVLARCLGEFTEPAEALARYQDLRRERTYDVAASALGMQPIFHNADLADPATATPYIERQWSRAANASRFDWIYGYDATAVPLRERPAVRDVA